MSLERQIDSLIEAGWKVIESDFSPTSIDKWRCQAFDCVTYLMGPEHGCSQHFREYLTKEPNTGGLDDNPVM